MSSNPHDTALMLRFQTEGDYGAFEELFHRHRDGLIGFLRRLSGSQAVAEDISQQSWLKLIELARGGGYVSTGAAFRTFLFTVARNHYFDEYHRKHEIVRTESLEARSEWAGEIVDPAHGPSQRASVAEVRGRLEAALSTLPAEQREVVALWSTGLDLKTVAEITGSPWHTVVSRKKYAIGKLRAVLVESGADGSV